MLLLLQLSGGVSEDLGLVLGICEAHVVIEVCDHLPLADVVLLEEFGLLLFEALKHGLVVCGGVEHAHVVHLLSILEVLVLIVELSAGGSIENIRSQSEGLSVCGSLHLILNVL